MQIPRGGADCGSSVRPGRWCRGLRDYESLKGLFGRALAAPSSWGSHESAPATPYIEPKPAKAWLLKTQMERSYGLKRAHTAAPKTFCHARVRAARQRETVKASNPNRAQLKGSIPRHAPLECLFSGPRRDSVYLNTTCQTPPPGYELSHDDSPSHRDSSDG